MLSRLRFIAPRFTSAKSTFVAIFAITGGLFAFPSFEEAKSAADQGSAKGQGIVATYYAIGWQTSKNPVLAVSYAQQSARAGDPLGKFRLGALLRNGEGITKDEALGLRLQNEAAAIWGKGFDEGDPFAMTAVGVALFQGKVVTQDKARAAQLYKKAADMGYAPAQFNYAMCAKDGQGIPINPDLCLAYLSKSAENGYRLANEALGQPTSTASTASESTSTDKKNSSETPKSKPLKIQTDL
jgi:TPR repeat protein